MFVFDILPHDVQAINSNEETCLLHSQKNMPCRGSMCPFYVCAFEILDPRTSTDSHTSRHMSGVKYVYVKQKLEGPQQQLADLPENPGRRSRGGR